MSRIAAELALFAGVGFLLFGLNDLVVDIIYFGRKIWRSATIYNRFPRAYASTMPASKKPGLFVIFVPAWDESSVIASMLKATLRRLDFPNYRIFVGHYENDPATAAAIASVSDPRIESVTVHVAGPTTKADCLNHLYGIM
ncbi:MAG: glycosyltransferase [Sphingomicrobium sp.]